MTQNMFAQILVPLEPTSVVSIVDAVMVASVAKVLLVLEVPLRRPRVDRDPRRGGHRRWIEPGRDSGERHQPIPRRSPGTG